MIITYIDIVPSYIENTTMRQSFRDGVPGAYSIKPIEGYVLHDAVRDQEDIDMETGNTIIKLGYSVSISTCMANYDFTTNPREFYTIEQPIEEVKEEAIVEIQDYV